MPTRAGSTLSEVLVALGIMAIGVVSLASLFPISVLKTARANQLTVATNSRYNAESMMRLYPHIFSDPNPADSNGDGQPFNDYDFAQGQPFLFDPLATVAGRPVPMPGASDYPTPGAGRVGLISRYGGGFDGSFQSADAICSGTDTWTTRHEGSILVMDPAFTQMTVQELSALNFNSLPASGSNRLPGANQMRVLIFYNGGKSSVARTITAIGPSNSLIWTEDLNSNNTLDAGEDQNSNFSLDLNALPAGVTYETARLESRERRYTWLLTVRPQDLGGSFTGPFSPKPSFDVSVVVYFGRGFTNDEELIFGTAPVGSTVTIPNLVSGSTVAMPQGTRSFVMTFPASSVPYLKRGGYIFDAQNGYWYQIENFSDPAGGTTSTITLTSNILKDSTLAMFPRGVVDVYPIPPQTP